MLAHHVPTPCPDELRIIRSMGLPQRDGPVRHAVHSPFPAPDRSPAPEAVQPPMSGRERPLRCFLIEDSALIRQNLQATLEELLGARVVGHAEDESAALQWLRNHPGEADVAVVDLFLRSGSGLEVLRHAPRGMQQPRLIVLSNYATLDMRRRCTALGADAVFDKSSELEELLAYCERLQDDERPAH
ncbi:MAG: hypothetical protein RLY78_85 [Pseudomonadota bacterium]